MDIKGIFIAFLIIFSNHLFSQSRISGKVLDGETALPVSGATILIKGDSKGVSSDVDGNFFIYLAPSKKHTLVVSSVGYQSKEITDIDLTNGETPVLNITLNKISKELEGVVVRASARRESVATLYSAQKLSSSISDGISADVIKKSPDRNTGDVLKRVSGTSVQDDKFVVIRGLSERYNTALLNNAILPSTEPDKKAFAFNIIPASVVDNIVIYKSATPDLPGDFAGGAARITTKQYPSSKLSELGLSIGYNSLTTFKAFKNSQPNGKMDFLGFLDNSRSIPNAYYMYRNGFINQSDDYKIATTKMFPNNYGYQDASSSLPNLSLSYTGGNSKIYSGSKKLGYIYTIGYGMGRQFKPSDLYEYDINKAEQYHYNTDYYIQKRNLNALLNLAYSLNSNNTLSWKNLFNNDFAKTTGLRNGQNISNGLNNILYYRSVLNEAKQDGLFNSVFEGKHKLNKNTLDWNVSYSLTYRSEPDQRILTFTSTDNTNFYRKLSNENSPSIQNAGRIYSLIYENIFGANANYLVPFTLFDKDQKLKIGYSGYYRLKNVEVNALGYASLTTLGQEIPASTSGNMFNIFTPENIDRYGITIANIGNNTADYQGKGMLNAGYLMLNNRLADKVKFDWGVRMENYNQELIPVKGINAVTRENLDFLPSGNLTFEITPKTNIRVAGFQSVNRPEFREIASYSLYDYNTDYIYRGNPDLVRSKNTNADLRFEHYHAPGEIISASVFYKYFNNPIEQINQGNSILSYQNAVDAKVYGAELEFRKKLDFMKGDFFNNTTFYTNLSYIKGNIQLAGSGISDGLMQGLSPYLVNGGLYYSDNNFSFNILYNRIGPRLSFRGQGDAGMDIYEKPRNVLDAQLSKFFMKKKLEVKLTAGDILADPYVMYYRFDKSNKNMEFNQASDRVTRSYKLGTTGTLSLKYNF
jgi:hypothetical protein